MTEYKIGDLVFAKVRGYSPWPAKIRTLPERSNQYEVHFFGTAQTGFVTTKELWTFDDVSVKKFGNAKKGGRALKLAIDECRAENSVNDEAPDKVVQEDSNVESHEPQDTVSNAEEKQNETPTDIALEKTTNQERKEKTTKQEKKKEPKKRTSSIPVSSSKRSRRSKVEEENRIAMAELPGSLNTTIESSTSEANPSNQSVLVTELPQTNGSQKENTINLSKIRAEFKNQAWILDSIVVFSSGDKAGVNEDVNPESVEWIHPWAPPPSELGSEIQERWVERCSKRRNAYHPLFQQHYERDALVAAGIQPFVKNNLPLIPDLDLSEAMPTKLSLGPFNYDKTSEKPSLEKCLGIPQVSLDVWNAMSEMSRGEMWQKYRQKRCNRLSQFVSQEHQVFIQNKEIRLALRKGQFDVDKALTAMNGLHNISISPLLILRNPSLMQTIQLCRFFKATENAEEIEKAANRLYHMFEALFISTSVPGSCFETTYARLVDEVRRVRETVMASGVPVSEGPLSRLSALTDQAYRVLEQQIGEWELNEPPLFRKEVNITTKTVPSLRIERYLTTPGKTAAAAAANLPSFDKKQDKKPIDNEVEDKNKNNNSGEKTVEKTQDQQNVESEETEKNKDNMEKHESEAANKKDNKEEEQNDNDENKKVGNEEEGESREATPIITGGDGDSEPVPDYAKQI